jgi:hypothetical protein
MVAARTGIPTFFIGERATGDRKTNYPIETLK